MARPKTPIAKARVTGAALRNPARYAQPIATLSNQLPPIGEPPAWLKPNAQEAWRELVSDIPWLNRSHSGILSITAMLAGRLREDPEIGIKALSLLRMCLSSLGATPVDAHRVAMPSAPDVLDPAEEYF